MTKIKDKLRISKAKGKSNKQQTRETLQATKEWHDIFKVMKGENLQSRILYSARLLFRFDGEIKSSTDNRS